MGSKQSSSSEFKRHYVNSSQIKNQRKLSEDLSARKFFSIDENEVSGNLYSGSISNRSEQQLKKGLTYTKITTGISCDSDSHVECSRQIINSNNSSNNIYNDKVQTSNQSSYSTTSTCSEDSDNKSSVGSVFDNLSPLNLSTSPLSDLKSTNINLSENYQIFENISGQSTQESNLSQGNATVFKYEYQANKVYIVFMQNGKFIFDEKMTPTEDFYGGLIHQVTLDLIPGEYQYYFLADGMRKYNLDDNYQTLDENLIVNYIIIPDDIQTQGSSLNSNSNNNLNNNLNNSTCDGFRFRGGDFRGSEPSTTTTTTTTWTTTKWHTQDSTETIMIMPPRDRRVPHMPRVSCMKASASAACCAAKSAKCCLCLQKKSLQKRVKFTDAYYYCQYDSDESIIDQSIIIHRQSHSSSSHSSSSDVVDVVVAKVVGNSQ